MKEEPRTLEEIAAEVKHDLNEQVDQWIRSFSNDTDDLSSFPSINQLESSMGELDSETRKIYLNMVSDCLSNIDEKELISSKKENLKKRG